MAGPRRRTSHVAHNTTSIRYEEETYDCGTGATPTDVGQRFTDTFAYRDLKLTFTFSCYLIKHGDEYMVWDTGFAPGTNANAPKVGIGDRLKESTAPRRSPRSSA